MGVPQVTKLGPIFLIMINDLAMKSPIKSSHWKYVDDITISEVITSGASSVLQSDLDTISSWAKHDNMNLNPKKCKEMIICPLKIPPDITPLNINGCDLKKVSSHKVLGIILSDNLKWNDNIREVVTKA